MAERTCQNVLVVDNGTRTSRLALEILAARGARGIVADGLAAAEKALRSHSPALVIVDLAALRGESGGDSGRRFELVRRIRAEQPELPVLAIGEDDSAQAAMEAIRQGCDEFLVKPLDRAKLEACIASLLPDHEVAMAAPGGAYPIAGRSPELLETLGQARKIAPTSMPVLITGESGTGKELISYYIHWQSRRSAGPYIRVNCAALSESLLESELFGHERGAFTGAYSQRKGRFEMAHGGTLLLDEISETGAKLQAELLRVLEQQDFERVGGSESVCVNVRVISTTNRDLHREMEAAPGAIEPGLRPFRRDLYYRIGAVRIEVPPLRRRRDDIPVLAWHFVNQCAGETRRTIARLDEKMMDLFHEYSWPGNVRQLRNVIRTALALGEGRTLSLDGVPHVEADLRRRPPAGAGQMDGQVLSLREMEREAIFEALRRTKSHQAKAASLLGITDRTLREKLRRYRQQEAVVV